MEVMIVHTNEEERDSLMSFLENASPLDDVVGFDNENSACGYIKTHKVDFALIEANAAKSVGMRLATFLKRSQKDAYIVLMTKDNSLALSAFRLGLNGCIEDTDSERLRSHVYLAKSFSKFSQ